jgi:hypothetical protein
MEIIMKKLSLVALAAAALFAVPASATVSLASVASVTVANSSSNMRFVRAPNGLSGNLISGTGTTASWASVGFTFGAGSLANALGSINAEMLADLSANTAAQALGTLQIQAFNAGSISFRSVSAIVLGGQTFAAGSNLLSYSFGSGLATLAGSGRSGSINVAGTAGDFTVSSDFLDFAAVGEHDFAVMLSGLSANLGFTAGQVLNGFTGTGNMQFNTNVGASVIPGIPEPANWLMLIMGFGVVGGLARARRSTLIAAA